MSIATLRLLDALFCDPNPCEDEPEQPPVYALPLAGECSCDHVGYCPVHGTYEPYKTTEAPDPRRVSSGSIKRGVHRRMAVR